MTRIAESALIIWVTLLIFFYQVLAKLACGLNKPNRQTILPLGSVAELFNSLPISKMWVPSPARSERIDHAQHRLTRTNGRLTINLCHRITTHPCRRNLGGKLGVSITETLGVENMGDVTRFSQAQLEQHFGEKTGWWDEPAVHFSLLLFYSVRMS